MLADCSRFGRVSEPDAAGAGAHSRPGLPLRPESGSLESTGGPRNITAEFSVSRPTDPSTPRKDSAV